MQSVIYVLYDKKLGRFMTPPMFTRDDREAVVNVKRALPNGILPDVLLHRVGTFDDKTAVIMTENPVIIPLEEVKVDE